MNKNLYDVLTLAVAVSFILALKGLSSPKSARRGNLIGAAGAFVATDLVFFSPGMTHNHKWWILGALTFGLIIGIPAARRIQMTQITQIIQIIIQIIVHNIQEERKMKSLYSQEEGVVVVHRLS